MNLSENCVLITGGTSGIGLAFAEQFYSAGSKVILCGRRADRLLKIQDQFPGIVTICCDLMQAAGRRELFEQVVAQYPQTNVLLNNAGIQLAMDLTKEVDLQRISSELETNLVAPIHLISLFAGHLSKQKQPALINVSSGLAFVPISFMPVYCASKAAIHSLTLSLRHQLRNSPVKVFEIIPPSVDTELGHERRTDKSQTHGGMPVEEFIKEAMEALRLDVLEAPIAQAKGLRTGGDALFARLNPA